MAGCDDDYDYSIEDWKTIDSVIDGDDERDAGGDDGWDADHDDDIEDWRTIDMVMVTQHARRLEGSADYLRNVDGGQRTVNCELRTIYSILTRSTLKGSADL